jgi:hypothetical protein
LGNQLSSASSRIFTVKRHANNRDFWIILTNGDTVKSYLLTTDSLYLNPVETIFRFPSGKCEIFPSDVGFDDKIFIDKDN